MGKEDPHEFYYIVMLIILLVCMCVCVRACVCVCACVRACVRACAWVRVCMGVRVCRRALGCVCELAYIFGVMRRVHLYWNVYNLFAHQLLGLDL